MLYGTDTLTADSTEQHWTTLACKKKKAKATENVLVYTDHNVHVRPKIHRQQSEF